MGSNKVENGINKRNNTINIKFSHLIIAIVIIIIIIALILFFILESQKENNINQNTNNMQIEIQENKQYQVEIGKDYSYVLNDEVGSIRFNTEKDFIIRTGIINSAEIMEVGTYIISGNIIKLTINYNSNNDYGNKEENPNYVSVPYEMKMTILDDGNIEYKNEYGTYLYIKENGNNNVNTNTLIEENSNSLIDNNTNYVSSETFLNNLTDKNKDFIKKKMREKIIETEKDINEQNFVEDRFEILDNEIIYTYIDIFTDSQGRIKAKLRARTYVMTPLEKISYNIENDEGELYNYIVIKELGNGEGIDSVNLLSSSGITKEEISTKIPELNEQIEKRLNNAINQKNNEDQIKKLLYNYLQYIEDNYSSYIPEGFNRPKLRLQDTKEDYYKLDNKSKSLLISQYRHSISGNNAYENSYIEYISVGVCIDTTKLPLQYSQFDIIELISTGYLKKNIEETIAVSEITKMLSSETSSWDSVKYQQMYSNNEKYIFSKFNI